MNAKAITKIMVAQVKIVPEKKKMQFNHDRLMKVLAQIAPNKTTVTVAGECFLDGYVVMEEELRVRPFRYTHLRRPALARHRPHTRSEGHAGEI